MFCVKKHKTIIDIKRFNKISRGKKTNNLDSMSGNSGPSSKSTNTSQLKRTKTEYHNLAALGKDESTCII